MSNKPDALRQPAIDGGAASLIVLAEVAVHPDHEARQAVLRRLAVRTRPTPLSAVIAEARRFADAYSANLTPDSPKDHVIDTLVTYLLWSVAVREQLEPSVIELLSSVPDHFVRTAAAMHPDAPTAVLVVLAGDDSNKVRVAVAEHSATPRETLSVLAEDEDPHVREKVAGNPNTPEQDLVCLAADEDVRVRDAVSVSPPVATSIRVSLAVRLAESYVGDGYRLGEVVDSILGMESVE